MGLINFFVYTIFWACAFSADCKETVNGDWSKDMVASPPPTRPYDMKYMAVAGDDQFNWVLSEVDCISAPPEKLSVAMVPIVVVRVVVWAYRSLVVSS